MMEKQPPTTQYKDNAAGTELAPIKIMIGMIYDIIAICGICSSAIDGDNRIEMNVVRLAKIGKIKYGSRWPSCTHKNEWSLISWVREIA